MKKDVFTRPFPPDLVKQRKGQGGKLLSYVETHAVTARLNEGCDAWSFEVIEHQILDEEVIVIGKLVADGVTKMAFGGSAITRDRDGRAVSVADDAKSAASDCLKKAASLLGVALELYGGGPVEAVCDSLNVRVLDGNSSVQAFTTSLSRVSISREAGR